MCCEGHENECGRRFVASDYDEQVVEQTVVDSIDTSERPGIKQRIDEGLARYGAEQQEMKTCLEEVFPLGAGWLSRFMRLP